MIESHNNRRLVSVLKDKRLLDTLQGKSDAAGEQAYIHTNNILNTIHPSHIKFTKPSQANESSQGITQPSKLTILASNPETIHHSSCKHSSYHLISSANPPSHNPNNARPKPRMPVMIPTPASTPQTAPKLPITKPDVELAVFSALLDEDTFELGKREGVIDTDTVCDVLSMVGILLEGSLVVVGSEV